MASSFKFKYWELSRRLIDEQRNEIISSLLWISRMTIAPPCMKNNILNSLRNFHYTSTLSHPRNKPLSAKYMQPTISQQYCRHSIFTTTHRQYQSPPSHIYHVPFHAFKTIKKSRSGADSPARSNIPRHYPVWHQIQAVGGIYEKSLARPSARASSTFDLLLGRESNKRGKKMTAIPKAAGRDTRVGTYVRAVLIKGGERGSWLELTFFYMNLFVYLSTFRDAWYIMS